MIREYVRSDTTIGSPLGTGSGAAGPQPLPVVAGTPAIVTNPEVVGLPRVGDVLRATTGAWRGATPMAFTYQWQRCAEAIGFASCTDIPHARSVAYTLTPEDTLYFLRVVVTATNGGGGGVGESALTAPVFGIYTYGQAKALGYDVPSSPVFV